jgi:hypothetical protein
MKYYDKLLHIGAGFVSFLAVVFMLNHPIKILIGLSFVAFLGYAKERYDALHPDKHTNDGWDAYFTVIGSILGYVLYYILISAGILLV